MPRLFRMGALLLLASLLAGTVSLADTSGNDDSSADDGSEKLAEYVEVNVSSLPSSNTISSKLALPLQRTPTNVVAVTETLMREQGAVLLGDALKNVSGMNIQNGSGVHDYFVIRGFDSISSGLLLTDGTAEPEVSYYQLYNVEAVEVLKGAGGYLYGTTPLAGAVNIVRKQPLPANFTDFGASFGSHSTYDATLDWNASAADERVSFRLNGLWRESDHYRDDKEGKHAAINPSLTWRTGENSSLTFNYEYVDAEYSPDAGIPIVGNRIADVPRRRSYQSAGDFSDQTLNRFQVDFETRLSDRLSLRNKTYYRDLDWRTDGTLISGVGLTTPPGSISRRLASLDDRQQFVGNQFEAIFELGNGRVKHRLLAGLDVKFTSDEYTFGVASIDDIGVDTLTETPVLFPRAADASGDVDTFVAAPYLVDQIKLSPEFELLAGVRYDYIDTDGDAKSLLFPTGTPAASFSRDDSELSPMLGAVYSPGETLSVYANAGRSYAPASSRLVDELAPDNREPEQSTAFEVGVKKRFADGRIRTTFAVYQLEREDIAIPDANGLTQQAGDQRSRGFEFELAAEPLPKLLTFFTYAYNDAELTEFVPFVSDGAGGGGDVDYSGNTPFMAPEHVVNLWVSRQFDGGLGVAGGARYVGEQFVSEDNAFEIDSSVVLDGAIFYDFKSWRLKLNLKNLTDTEYERRGIAGPASVIPADPFSVYASFEVRI